MSSEIGNKSLLRKMSEALQILDVKQSPSRLDTDTVKAIYQVGSIPAAKYSLARRTEGGLDITGVSQVTQSIFGTTANGATDPLFMNAGRPAEWVGLSALLLYNGAGATADNGVPLGLAITRYANYPPRDAHDVLILDAWSVVQTGRTEYNFALGSYGPGNVAGALAPFQSQIPNYHVPADDHVSITIYRPNGGTWPAGTTLNIRAVAFFDGPIDQTAWVPPS